MRSLLDVPDRRLGFHSIIESSEFAVAVDGFVAISVDDTVDVAVIEADEVPKFNAN